MFNVKELDFIKKVLVETKSQDEITLSLIKKITSGLNAATKTKECLWKFFWDCGRRGEVEGIFKATREDVENAIGKEVYFGEILGKHSEVCGTLEDGECELISDDPIYVINAVEIGYNPLDYIEDEEEDEED